MAAFTRRDAHLSPGRNKKTRREAGFLSRRKNAQQLSGRIQRSRSARARGHAGSHAGAGQDSGVGAEVVHEARIMTRRKSMRNPSLPPIPEKVCFLDTKVIRPVSR